MKFKKGMPILILEPDIYDKKDWVGTIKHFYEYNSYEDLETSENPVCYVDERRIQCFYESSLIDINLSKIEKLIYGV